MNPYLHLVAVTCAFWIPFAIALLLIERGIAVSFAKRPKAISFTGHDLRWDSTQLSVSISPEEVAVLRRAFAADRAKTNPGEDVTSMSDEEFLEKLFGLKP